MGGWKRWLFVGVVVVAMFAVAGPYVYIHFIEGKAPKKLTLSQNSTATSADPTADPSAASEPLDGVWKVGAGSQAGYRVKEILFGQNNEAVGRTTAVTGTAAIAGTNVTAADVTVDLTQVSSDQARRDSQFHHRIMDTSTYPTATFKLTQPIALSSTNGRVSVKATGDLTAHGVTKSVVAELQAQRSGSSIRVSGSIPITFADYNIPNPSFGPISTEDHGLIEFLVVFAR